MPSRTRDAAPERPRLAGGGSLWRLVLAAVALASPAIVVAWSVLPVPSSVTVPVVGHAARCHRNAVPGAQPSAVRPAPVAFAQVPGDVLSASRRTTVEGFDEEVHDGRVLLVTVLEAPVTSRLDLALAADDCDVELLSRRQVLGDQTIAEDDAASTKFMDASKQIATYLSMRAAGVPVSVSGGGVIVDGLCVAGPESACVTFAPAAKVLAKGDVITAVAGVPVHLVSDIAPVLAGSHDGDEVDVSYRRVSVTATGRVTLVRGPQGQPQLGITPSSLLPDDTTFDLPAKVTIDPGDVGGDSAGLAFTLALVDDLTEGDLFGGHDIAATGEVSPTGEVLAVGGIRQKAVAARQAGAEVFLVPEHQVADAALGAGRTMRVVGVASVDDALGHLNELVGRSALPRVRTP